VPVAVVRGYPGAGAVVPDGAAVLLRDAASDMFSLGTAEARAAGLREAAAIGDLDPDPGGALGDSGLGDAGLGDAAPGKRAGARRLADPVAVDRALALVAFAPGTSVAPAEAGMRIWLGADATPAALMRLGADVHRLRAALAAEGIASTLLTEDAGLRLVLSAA
jgi:coenzyme F420-0:L-glutamate ligase/coenzyme F420-1:gamma-L-glutamate ligase